MGTIAIGAIVVASLLPAPASTTLTTDPCPPRTAGCYWKDRDQLSITTDTPPADMIYRDLVVRHELGHAFDAKILTPGDRRAFARRVLHDETHSWDRLDWQEVDTPGPIPLNEQFADIYAGCADPDGLVDRYGFDGSYRKYQAKTMRRGCRMIARIVARARPAGVLR